MGTEKKLTRKSDDQKTAVVKPVQQSLPQTMSQKPTDMPTATRLQQTIGNQATRRFYNIQVQRKMTLGPVGDKYEQEADAVAKQVVSKLHTSQPQDTSTNTAQRQEEEEEIQMKPTPTISSLQRQEEEEEVQAKAGSMLDGGELSNDVETAVTQAKSSGQPMQDTMRQPMEQAFSADFSQVKIHTDSQSDNLNRSLQARAFTSGQDVFFRQGEYNPGSSTGQELIAHELTHVVQQNSTVARKPTIQKHPAPFVAETEDEIQTKRDTSTIQRHLGGHHTQSAEDDHIQNKPITPNTRKRTIQRVFKPAITNAKAHLRKTNNSGNLKTGLLGRIGRKIPSGSELIVDPNTQKTQTRWKRSDVTWTRAVDVPPTNWDQAVNATQGGYIRDAKVDEKNYPQNSDLNIPFRNDINPQVKWHIDIGEYIEIERSKTHNTDMLIKTGNEFKRLPAGGAPLRPLNLLEKTQVQTVAYKIVGRRPNHPNEFIISEGSDNTYYTHNTTNGTDNMNPVLGNDEVWDAQISKRYEKSQDIVKGDALALNTVTIPYQYLDNTQQQVIINVTVKGVTTDEHYANQLQAVRNALLALSGKQVALKDGLEILLSSTRATTEEALPIGPGVVVLSPVMFENPNIAISEDDSEIKGGVPQGGSLGVAHQIGRVGNLNPQQTKMAIGGAVAIHEIGHVMHQQNSPNKVKGYQKGEVDQQEVQEVQPLAKEVSHYAASSIGASLPLEFVAEVFTGIVLGKKYSQAVIDKYLDLEGYKTWQLDNEVVEG